MSWLKPPPLVDKPACPAVKTSFSGLPSGLVKKVTLLSIGFWLSVLFLPAFILLILAWPALKGTFLGVVCALGVMFVGYVCLVLGIWASQKMIGLGYLQKAMADKAKTKK